MPDKLVPCPCGRSLMKPAARTCRRCHDEATRARTLARRTCPKCGGWKHRESKVCWLCAGHRNPRRN